MTVHFQRELGRLKKRILSLSALVEQRVRQAVKSVEERDEQLACQVIDGDDQIVAARGDRLQERFGRRLHVAVQKHLAGGVKQADVHGLHVAIDSAVVPMLSVVESHTLSSCVAFRIDPAIEPTLTSNRRRAE